MSDKNWCKWLKFSILLHANVKKSIMLNKYSGWNSTRPLRCWTYLKLYFPHHLLDAHIAHCMTIVLISTLIELDVFSGVWHLVIIGWNTFIIIFMLCTINFFWNQSVVCEHMHMTMCPLPPPPPPKCHMPLKTLDKHKNWSNENFFQTNYKTNHIYILYICILNKNS